MFFLFSFVWIEIAICSKRCIYACVFEYGLSTFSCLWSGLLEDLSTWFHILTVFSMIYLKISYNCLHFLQIFRGFLPYEWDLKWFWMWLIWLETDLNRNMIDSSNWLWCHLYQSQKRQSFPILLFNSVFFLDFKEKKTFFHFIFTFFLLAIYFNRKIDFKKKLLEESICGYYKNHENVKRKAFVFFNSSRLNN